MKIRGVVALIGLASLLVLGTACGNGESGTPGGATPPQAGVGVPAPVAPTEPGVQAPAPAAPAQSGLTAADAPAPSQTGRPAPAPAAPVTEPADLPKDDEPASTDLPIVLGVPVPAPTGVEAPAVQPAVEPAPPVQEPASAAFAQASGVSTQGYSPLLQVGSSQAGIWVTGLGTISLEPDLAVVTIGVETQAETVAQARDEAATAMAAIVEAVKSHGLTDRDVQTRSFNIFPVYEFPEIVELGQTTRKRVLVGYRVSNTASIKIRDLDDVGPIIDDVAAAGGDATRINGISFTSGRHQALHDAASGRRGQRRPGQGRAICQPDRGFRGPVGLHQRVGRAEHQWPGRSMEVAFALVCPGRGDNDIDQRRRAGAQAERSGSVQHSVGRRDDAIARRAPLFSPWGARRV